MKRKEVLVILVLGIFLVGFVSAFSGAGLGTSTSPYQIRNCTQLQEINNGLGASYVLMNDIDCGNIANFGVVADGSSSSKYFTGVLDGNHSSVRNLKISSSNRYTGVLGYAKGATIKNLKFINVSISGDDYVGGVVGYCISCSMNQVYLEGKVSGVNYIGGVAGLSSGGSLNKIGANANVAGYLTSSTGNLFIGGIVGELRSSLYDSYFIGNITGVSTSSNTYKQYGGIVGRLSSGGYKRVYAISNIIHSGSLSNILRGGLVGYVGSTFGGFLDYKYCGNFGNSQARYCVSNTPSASFTSLEDLRNESTFTLLDFDSVWRITSYDNQGYPYLQWEELSYEIEPETPSYSIVLDTIQNRTSTEGNLSFFAVASVNMQYCSATIYNLSDENFMLSFYNTTPIVNNSQNKITYSGLPVGNYSVEIFCALVNSDAVSNQVAFRVISPFNEGYSWSDMNGRVITSANLSDSVILSFLTHKGVSMGYQILKNSQIVASGTTDKGYAIWKANASGTYSFGIGAQSSGNLAVSSGEQNKIPNATISSPEKGSGESLQKYSVGYTINFEQESLDEDDLLSLIWNFGDGQSQTRNYSLFEKINAGGNSGAVTYSYSSPGVYKVKLTSQETGRAQNSKDFINIQIFKEGINVFPVIVMPEDGEVLDSTWVKMDGSGTYVINCTSGYIDDYFTTDDELLNCSYVDPNLDENSKELFFNWSLGNGLYRSGYWNEEDNSSVVFRAKYPYEGTHTVLLNVTYSDSSGNDYSGVSSVIFSSGVTEYQCIYDSSKAFWQNINNDWEKFWVINETMESGEEPEDMCDNEAYMGSGFCCPTDMYCEGGECLFSEAGIVSCTELETKDSCNNAGKDIAEGLFELFNEDYEGICDSQGTFDSYVDSSGALCSNVTFCDCYWNDEKKSCKSALVYESSCEGEEDEETYTCFWSQEGEIEDLCGEPEAKMRITYVASSDDPFFINGAGESYCKDQVVEYPCSVSVQLPFFEWQQFILAVLIIFGVYGLIKRRN